MRVRWFDPNPSCHIHFEWSGYSREVAQWQSGAVSNTFESDLMLLLSMGQQSIIGYWHRLVASTRFFLLLKHIWGRGGMAYTLVLGTSR